MYRSWRPHCVQVRARSDAHLAHHGNRDRAYAILAWDYAYLSSTTIGDDEGAEARGESPLLCCRDGLNKGLFCYVLPAKGVDFQQVGRALDVIMEDLERLGYKRVCIRSDNEPALVALLRLVARRFAVQICRQRMLIVRAPCSCTCPIPSPPR